jgi:hypothetical protein
MNHSKNNSDISLTIVFTSAGLPPSSFRMMGTATDHLCRRHNVLPIHCPLSVRDSTMDIIIIYSVGMVTFVPTTVGAADDVTVGAGGWLRRCVRAVAVCV